MAEDPNSELQRLGALEELVAQLKRTLTDSGRAEKDLRLPLQVVTFAVEGYRVAVPVVEVEEVTPMVMVSPLPHAPAAVRGTVDYRGRLVSVLDLRYAFTGNHALLGPESLLAIVSAGNRMFALAVDAVEDVSTFGAADMEATHVLATMPSFVQCLFRTTEGAVMLLDAAGLLAAGEFDHLHQLLSAHAEQVEAKG